MMLHEFRAININSASTGEKYIVFNILYLTKEYAPEKLDMLINEKNMDITKIYEVFASSQAANSDMKSLLLFMDDYIEILETNPKRNSMKLIIVYILRMQAYVKYGFGSVSESNNFIDRALDVIEKYKIKNDVLKIEALKVRCEYYRKIGNIKKSLDDNNSLGEILANLNTKNMKGLVLSSHETASMLINKSINMKNLNQLKDSIKFSLQAKELVSNDNSYDGRTLYSNALNTLGLCYIKDKKYDEAEKNIRESIDICEKLIEEYQINDNLVFNLFANLCQVYRWNKKFDEAIDLYTDSINRIISKESDDNIIDLNLKALQYNGRGNIYFEMGQIDNGDHNFQLSIKDYLKGIDVIESLHSSNQDIRLLEQLYINAYNIFENWIVDKEKSRKYETKVNDISRRLMRIQLDNHVDDDKTIDDIKYFVQASKIFESAQKYVEKNQLKKAEKKYCDCIMLLEKN